MSYTAKTTEEIKQDEIKELKSYLNKCEAALLLALDPDTAIAVKIALGGNNYFELWVSENDKVRKLIENEKLIHQKELEELQLSKSN